MSADIGKGDWVECIQSSPTGLCVTGGIYCVEDVIQTWGECPVCGDDGDAGLIFRGHPKIHLPDGILMSWCPCRFRPIYRPKSEFIEALKQPAPPRECEAA